MSTRLLKILLGVLGLLVVAWIVARSVSDPGDRTQPVSFGLPDDAEFEIDSVVIAFAGGNIRLVQSDGWTVNGFEAVAETGESLKRALDQARIGQLVSRNPSNHDRLGVTAAGRFVKVYLERDLEMSFIVGNQAQVFDQAYVRRPDEDAVYTLEGSLVDLVNRGVDDWRDRAILAASRDDIQRVEITHPDETFALVRGASGWLVEPSGSAAASGAVANLLGQLAGLRAVGFAANSVVDTLSWDSATAEVRVLGPGEFLLGELAFLRREGEGVGYYVRRAGSPVVYTVGSYTGDQILKRQGDLATASAP